MGRPVNPRFLGDPNDPDAVGFQITGTIIVDVGEGVEGGIILRQRSNNRYLVKGDDSSVQRVCKLVNGVPQAVGEMSVSVFSELDNLIVPKDETDYSGNFSGGVGYAVADEITLSNGAKITVDDISKQLIVGETETDYSGSFVAGTGYTALDEITLSNGDIVTVDTVGGSDEVTGFTITTVNGVSVDGNELTQSSVDPAGGSGFKLTPGAANLEDVGEVTEFTVDSIGDSFTTGSTLTQSSVDPAGGTGFTITPSIADNTAARAAIGYARNINNRTVKTFDGDVLSWPDSTSVTERTKVDLQGQGE
jgi:hypothetical protein